MEKVKTKRELEGEKAKQNELKWKSKTQERVRKKTDERQSKNLISKKK